MIISRTYFKNNIHVDNAQDVEPNSTLLGNTTALDDAIAEYGRDVLIKCLGFSLFNELEAELDPQQTNGLKDTAHAKWDDLVNGKEYTLDGIPTKWNGLRFKEGTLDRSLIAEYVFFHFLSDEKASTTQAEVKNSIAASPYPKAVKAWRKFYSLTVGNYNTPSMVYKQHGVGIDWLGSNNGVRSLYQFIQDMNNLDAETYPNWLPSHFENLNNFGI